MRIILAIDHLGPGGAQRQLVELAVALSRSTAVETKILVYHDLDHYGARVREAGIECLRVTRRGRFDMGFALRLRRVFREQCPDLVHAFMAAPSLWSALAAVGLGQRRPVLVAGERAGKTGGNLPPFLEGIAYRAADAVTTNSGPMLPALEALGVDAGKLHYVPNGIDLATWDAGRDRPCPVDLEPGCFHAALIGRLEEQKNHDGLIEALSLLSPEERNDWRIWLIGPESGGGERPAALRARIAELGLAPIVRFVPPVKDVAALMFRLDLILLPSRFEGFPNVLLEAMASGLPSIATAVGDVPAMLEDGRTGLVLEDPEDPEALAAALRKMRAMDPEARRRMGQAAREVVEARYRMDVIASRYSELYEQLLA